MSKEIELSDEQMPVFGWGTDDGRIVTNRTKTEAMPGASRESFTTALVRQSDAQAKLAAKDAEIAALKKKVGAYQLLTKSQDVRIATMHALRSDWAEAIGTLASERLANAMLTNEIDALKAERDALKVAAKYAEHIDATLENQLQATLTQGLAPGWKAVPVKPTDAMVSAMLDWGTKQSEWEAILAAAPQPPVAQPSPAAVERKPLGKHEIHIALDSAGLAHHGLTLDQEVEIARVIEAAHGITAQ